MTKLRVFLLLGAALTLIAFSASKTWPHVAYIWKLKHSEMTTYQTQYPAKVVTIGNRITGIPYVTFAVYDDKPATYQGPFVEKLATEMDGLKTGDIVVFKANSTFWRYGSNREVIQRRDRVNSWRKIP